MEKVKVRTTMRPDVELEVTPQEATDLERQGLLVKDQKEADRTRPAGAKGEKA